MNGGNGQDLSLELQDRVLEAAATARSLVIRGSDSKAFLGHRIEGETLEVSGHQGILGYEPKELVITARGGTPLAEIEQTLAEHSQCLPFEPPHFGPNATLAGSVSAGLSGPRRPYAGSLRDYVLGARLLNGRGEILRFGGEVMKNVAGYDVSRLLAGAMGTLGIILDVSLKVLPIPAREITLVQTCSPDEALKRFTTWATRPLPISAAVCDGDRLLVRLSGASSAVETARKALGGDCLESGDAFWSDEIREQRHAFFQGDLPLWRLALPVGVGDTSFSGRQLIDWGGAQRWLRSDEPPATLFERAVRLGGHASLFRGGDHSGPIQSPLPAPLLQLHRRLKRAFDPQGIFNPGRLFPEF